MSYIFLSERTFKIKHLSANLVIRKFAVDYHQTPPSPVNGIQDSPIIICSLRKQIDILLKTKNYFLRGLIRLSSKDESNIC